MPYSKEARRWFIGLTVEQRRACQAIIEQYRSSHSGAGMSGIAYHFTIVRSPTTIHPPTSLVLRMYGRGDVLEREWRIT